VLSVSFYISTIPEALFNRLSQHARKHVYNLLEGNSFDHRSKQLKMVIDSDNWNKVQFSQNLKNSTRLLILFNDSHVCVCKKMVPQIKINK
jgi:hypothetical protein